MVKVAAVLFLAAAVSPAFAQFKCTGPDGKVAFQQGPCDSSAKDQAALRLRPEVNGGGSLSNIAPLDLRGSQSQVLAAITAAAETLVELGRDCKISLPIYGSRPEAMVPCQNFLDHQRAWRGAALDGLKRLVDDDKWFAQNSRAVDRTMRTLEEVGELDRGVAARLSALRRDAALGGSR